MRMTASAPSCSVTIPTLVLGADPTVTDRLVARLADIGIIDVDVASGYREARRRSAERDYLAVIIAGLGDGPAARDSFCRTLQGSGEDAPGLVLLEDGTPREGPSCGSFETAFLPQGYEADDLRRAVLTAVASAGHACKSAGLCRQTSCQLRRGLH